jgi:hypothetical protein
VEIKCELDATDDFLLQILLLAQHVSGTIMPIIRSSRVLYKWLLPVVFGTVKMEIVIFRLAAVVLSALIKIKIHLLHLVGILFPHIIDDARSKPHQSFKKLNEKSI